MSNPFDTVVYDEVTRLVYPTNLRISASLFGSASYAISASSVIDPTIAYIANVRPFLTASVTYYVNPTGSDSNNGLGPGTAFGTVQHAVDVAQGFDLGRNNITIQLADGGYTGSVMVAGPPSLAIWPGDANGLIIINGNAATASNVTILGFGGNHTVVSIYGAKLFVQNLRLQASGSIGNLLDAQYYSTTYFSNIIFDTCSLSAVHLSAETNGAVICKGNYTITNGCAGHAYALMNASIWIGNTSITIQNAPTFTTAFLLADTNGAMEFSNNTFTGSFTGSQYGVTLGGVINPGTPPSNYIPGTVQGYANTGGQYGAFNSSRRMLQSATTYYVHPTGSDSNDGFSPYTAFQTIQQAVNTVQLLDIGQNLVTIVLQNGSYTGSVIIGSILSSGTGSLTISGSSSSSVILLGAAGLNTISVNCPETTINIQNMTLNGNSSTGANLLNATQKSTVNFSNVVFGTGSSSTNHIAAQAFSRVTANGNYMINGGGAAHFYTLSQGTVNIQNKTISINNAPKFSISFALADSLGLGVCNGDTFPNTNVTGSRYSITMNAVINTAGGGANYFPGTSAGTTGSGGQYL